MPVFNDRYRCRSCEVARVPNAPSYVATHTSAITATNTCPLDHTDVVAHTRSNSSPDTSTNNGADVGPKFIAVASAVSAAHACA